MSLAPGTRLGPYEVTGSLGAGGMGEVYKARDTRLDRTVAIKVLPLELNADAERRARFEREARAVAALNHPHICTLFDIGEALLPNAEYVAAEQRDGRIPSPESRIPSEITVHYLVMEHLPGQTLADRLARRGPVPPAEALKIAVQIADALDAAHKHGIVHRDLKPGNVMLTTSGTGRSGVTSAKLLDFGLAKLAGHGEQPALVSATIAPTQAAPITARGTILGTLQYMAPEQLEGKEADARTDLWALGAMLYEMLTGTRAFAGDTEVSLIGNIMNAEPAALSTLQPLAPPSLERVVKKCLAKSPDDRWDTAHDVADELRWIAQVAGAGVEGVRGTAHQRIWQIATAVLALALVASLAGIWMRRPGVPAPKRQVQFTVVPPAPNVLTTLDVPALSPDGTQVAFTARPPGGPSRLFVRAIASLGAEVIQGTDGAVWPFWSPDSQRVGFFSGRQLKVVGLAGGAPVALADGYCCGTWNRDGIILFTGFGPNITDRGTFRVSSEGGVAAQVGRPDAARSERMRQWPVFFPDGRRFLYFTRAGRADVQGIYTGSLDAETVARVAPSAGHAVFVPPGFLVFRLRGRLVAQAFDWQQSRLSGEPVQIAEAVASAEPTAAWAALFSAVPEALAYIPGTTAPTTLVWLDRKGNRLGSVGDPGEYYSPQLSPDERTLAVGRFDVATDARDIWLFDLARGGAPSRFTFDPADDMNPAWSPDGTRVFFSSACRGQRDIYEKTASGTGEQRLLFGSEIEKNMEYVSPDGRLVLFNAVSEGAKQQVWALPLAGASKDGGKPFLFLSGPADIQSAALSPDGRIVAYMSSESGSYQVFVQALASGKRWPISTAGGTNPQWRSDGKELFYFAAPSTMMAVDIEVAGERLEAGIPRALFDAPFWRAGRNVFVPSRDGRRFLAVLQTEPPGSRAITVELNWMARLTRQTPSR